jgi:hypothetical protein
VENMRILVGHTGFVGSNLALKCDFDQLYNSKNISNAFGTKPDLLVYSGVRAEKFLANQQLDKDYEIVQEAFSNILKINPKKLVLISTIDVYKNPMDVNEYSPIDTQNLHPYGLNRYLLEKMIEDSGMDSLIVRLPGLFGRNLKKNFIYDFINMIPSMLSESKMNELLIESAAIKNFYTKQENGFYTCNSLDKMQKTNLRHLLTEIGFSAIHFTDSRATFQFYNLEYLWDHIEVALLKRITKLNLATEPIKVSDLYYKLKGEVFFNEIAKNIPNYNFKTVHMDIYNGKCGYIYNKEMVSNDIENFINQHKVVR